MQKIDLPDITKPVFKTTLQVRIYDINYGRHMGHDSFVSLLHEARVRFLRNAGFTEGDVGGAGVLVTVLFVNYKAEAFYGDEIEIVIGTGEMSRTSVDLHYEMLCKNSGKIIAKAITTITFFDFAASRVVAVPGVFLDVISR